MFSPTKKLITPDNFNFPFTPYKIQDDLMKSLYSVIENKQIGIYESPTGTGKSLTLTCGSIRWLLDHEQLVRDEITLKMSEINKEIEKVESNNVNIDWIDSQYQAIQKKDEANKLKKIKDLIVEYDEKMKRLKEKIFMEKQKKKNYTKQSDKNSLLEKSPSENNEIDDLTLPEYEDDDELENTVEEINELKYTDVKIFFCSRTHSQLSQVVREIKRSEYGDKVRCISLASRQNLCINPQVRKLNSVNLMNEKCLDMCKSQSKNQTSSENPPKRIRLEKSSTSSSRCQYKTQNLIDNLRDTSLVDILDIEDLVKEGENLKACPYYSSREAIKDAQIIMLPYQMLLHKKTRQQTGINLENNIVIIDEAHNLVDSITNIYSSEINLYQLKRALNQITSYKTKYFKRFSSNNFLRVYQLTFITKRLVKFFDNKSIGKSTRMIKSYELMSEGEFYKINIYHLLEFCEKTRFAQKVHYFAQTYKNVESQTDVQVTGVTNVLEKIKQKQSIGNKDNKLLNKNIENEQNENFNKELEEKIPSVIRPLLAFLETLMECANDGKVLITYDPDDDKKAGFKYCLQNPGGHFEQIIKDCRSVIIAGGTMQPTENLTSLLFKNYEDRIKLNFYNHVVPKESILPFAVQKGPSGKNFLFNFNQRSNKELLNELGMTLVNVCTVVPAGIVCFVASYQFLDEIFTQFQQEHYLEQISNKKYIFREKRQSTSTEEILKNYSKAIKLSDKNGAILFSVIGGKLSEGLNFTDELGRCVIVVGMPFPNKNSPDLLEKMNYLEKNMFAGAGRQYYNNMCMKSVNQCIGRSIRHINDYATVLLLDERYSQEWVQEKLPHWIRQSLKISTNFGSVQCSVAKFFRERKNC